MLKIAIVDDEAIICEQLDRFVTAYCAAILMPLLTEVYFSGETISQKLSQGERYDIILLDIELTECSMTAVHTAKNHSRQSLSRVCLLVMNN